MSPIKWSSSNNVGSPVIDQQHNEWVKRFNELEGLALVESQDLTDEYKLNFLKDLLDFSREHFSTEEAIFHKYAYPEAARHRKMHNEFERQVDQKYRELLKGELVFNAEILLMLGCWFVRHTSTEDRKTFDYINTTKRK